MVSVLLSINIFQHVILSFSIKKKTRIIFNFFPVSLTWQIGRKSTEQHGCYKSRSIKLNFSDSPAYYTTVHPKYNNSAVFLREDTDEGVKLAMCIGGHLKTLQVISWISYTALWLAEQINHTFQFRNCHGKFHGINPRAGSVWGQPLHTKTSFKGLV